MTSTETDTPDTSPPDAGDAPPAIESGERPATPFWQRPYVERYLVPFVMPLAIVVGLVIVVLNISRIFLAGHGHVSVVLGSLITAAILLGAAMLSAAPRMRSSSIALVAAGFVASIVLGGWLSVGSAEEEEEGGGELLARDGPAIESLEFRSLTALAFEPDEAQAPTGIVRITLTNQGGPHTFTFEDAGTLLAPLDVSGAGDEVTGRAFLGEPGEYDFYCEVPGHREAGMEGTITVEGDPTTLAQAEADAEEAGGGAGPTEGEPGEGGGEPGAGEQEPPAATPEP
jgi:plastocyanin